MQNKKVIIYGIGAQGAKLLHLVNTLGGGVDFFCHTYIDKGLTFEGIPVISFEELCRIKGKLLILIAVDNRELSRKIKLRLTGVFLNRADIRECDNLLERDVSEQILSQNYCLLCGSALNNFIPGGYALDIFKEHHIIGGGYRKNYRCPICGGVDRERWQFWVYSKNTGIFRDKCRVLHFAPETKLSEIIAANFDCDYYTGDIVPGRAMHQTNILDIQYKDGVFDYVIMNHVLEHIEDMERALSEVKRVMKPDGKLILSFPICTDMDTLEMPEVNTPEKRLKYYGQEDHVRLFGKDFAKKIRAFNLDVQTYSPKDYFKSDDINRYGFIEDDILMICNKK